MTLNQIEEAERLSQQEMECITPSEGGFLGRLAQLSESNVNKAEPDSSHCQPQPSEQSEEDNTSDKPSDEKNNLSEEEQEAVDVVKATFVELYNS